MALDVCRLRRRHKNAVLIMDKLTLMSSLHQTQPTIQILLSGNEFSGSVIRSFLSIFITHANLAWEMMLQGCVFPELNSRLLIFRCARPHIHVTWHPSSWPARCHVLQIPFFSTPGDPVHHRKDASWRLSVVHCVRDSSWYQACKGKS